MMSGSMPMWSRNLSRLPLLLLATVEGSALFLSAYIARALMYSVKDEPAGLLHRLEVNSVIFAVVMLLSLIAMGLYHFHQRINFREVLARIIVGVMIGALIISVLYQLVPRMRYEPMVVAIQLLVALGFLVVIRGAFLHAFDANIFRRRTIVLGAGERSLPVSNLRRRSDHRGFKVVAKIPAPGDKCIVHCEHLLEADKELAQIAAEKGADEIVIAMDERRGTLPVRELLDCKLMGIKVISLLEFLERETRKIRVDLVEPGWLILAPGFRQSLVRGFVKRALDVVVAGVAIILLLPVMVLIALLIKVFEGLDAPVFYHQRRVGYRGAEFEMLKFRSMSVDAEADGNPRWAQIDDERITRFGGVLRKTRLDELPQLLNILRGDMSLVGPRPERPEFVSELVEEIPYYAERSSVKPGLTGWAQLKYSYASSTDDTLEKLQYDLWYVKNHGLLLDLMILLQTVEVILWGKGAR